MVFSSTTFLFLFLPAVFFFYWLPDICVKIKQLFSKKSLDNQDLDLALYNQTANANSSSDLEDKKKENRDKGFVLANDASISLNITKHSLESKNTLNTNSINNLFSSENSNQDWIATQS